MKNRIQLAQVVVPVAALALVLSLALAPSAGAASAVERHQAWADTLQNVLDTTPELTAEEVSALAAAIREVDPRAFADDATTADREVLVRQADALASTLNCQTFGGVVEDFGELGKWLEENEVVSAALQCNCGDSGCARGYYCKSVNCVSPQGTTHWGRCAPESTDAEPVPVEPDDPVLP